MPIKERILKIKRWHSILSSFIFLTLLTFCTYLANLKLTEISLSEFGINESTGYTWNIILFIIGLLLYVDSLKNILKFFKDFINPLTSMFTFSSICLMATALIDMNYYIHNITAFLYFLVFSSSMFLFGYQLLKLHFRMGIISIILSILSMIIPIGLVCTMNSLAVPEITHTLFVLAWVIIMSYDKEYETIIKKIGL